MSPEKDIEQRFEIAVRLALGASRRPASPDCLTPEVIAAYYVYALNRVERYRCEAHISECPRCRETLDALIHAKPEDRISPESAAQVAEAELVEPGAPPPWRLKPAPPPAFELTRFLRTVGPTVLFLAILVAVILADVHFRQGMETGDAARVATVQAKASRRARRRARAARMNREDDELALNEVRPEPAARAPIPGVGSASSATARPVPGNVYSNPLFQGAPRAGHAKPSHLPGAATVPAHANAQSPGAEPRVATSAVHKSAPAAPSQAAKPVERPHAKVASNTSPAGASSLASSVAAPSAKPAAPSVTDAPPELAAAPANKVAAAAAVALASAAMASAKPSGAQAATGSTSPSQAHAATKVASAHDVSSRRGSSPALAPTATAGLIASPATKKAAVPFLIASASPVAKTTASATNTASGVTDPTARASASKASTPEIASEQSHKRAPSKPPQLAAREFRIGKFASSRLARKRAKRLAELRRGRHAELIASAREHREARAHRTEHPRTVAHAPSATAQTPRLADNQNSETGAAHADLVVASEPAQTSVLPALAPIAPGIPVPPRSVLVASPHRSVYWSLQDFGIIYRSTDRESWERSPSGTQDDLLAGAAPSRTVCWAVGRHGTVLLTTDGVHWTRIKSPTTGDLVGVTAASADVATVIARDGQRFNTFDGGSNWQQGNGESGAWHHLE